MRRIVLVSLALASFFAAGCGFGTDPSGCDICTTSAIVYGTVRDLAGVPIAGVRVAIEARAPSCQSSGIGSNQMPLVTDALGNYRAITLSPSGPRTVCLIVAVQPPAMSAFGPAADTGHMVRLEDDFPATQAHDSVRVDLTLRPVT
jgi:hypothetical protein